MLRDLPEDGNRGKIGGEDDSESVGDDRKHCPNIVTEYNKYMGSVDLFNQLQLQIKNIPVSSIFSPA